MMCKFIEIIFRESRGSIFIQNNSKFFGEDTPSNRIKEIIRNKKQQSRNSTHSQSFSVNKTISVLNEQRLKEFVSFSLFSKTNHVEKDPKYNKNIRKFHGLPSFTAGGPKSSISSTAQRFDQFVEKA